MKGRILKKLVSTLQQLIRDGAVGDGHIFRLENPIVIIFCLKFDKYRKK